MNAKLYLMTAFIIKQQYWINGNYENKFLIFISTYIKVVTTPWHLINGFLITEYCNSAQQ